tara:strand:- start:375 stop:836 length:462 start_codon:yes stop_codon:yes gene_type:complete
MNIQELETKYKELGAEIERLKQQPEGVWEPTEGGTFWMVDWSGGVRSLNPNNRAAVNHHNVYETEALARKASVLQRRSNLVIQVCLNFEPNSEPAFEPDWSDRDQYKYGFYFNHKHRLWEYSPKYYFDDTTSYVSTLETAVKVADYLNSQEIK